MPEQDTPETTEAHESGATVSSVDDIAIATLQAEVADLKDRLLRRQAEFDNFRRRAERERADTLEYAAADTVKQLLPILDDFARATAAPCADANYGKGIELISGRIAETMKKLGLEEVPTVDRIFDPMLHEAIDMAPSTEVPNQTILAELQKGYTLRGKLLRPAMVRVAVNNG
jgi:molecular chaperone GrpE